MKLANFVSAVQRVRQIVALDEDIATNVARNTLGVFDRRGRHGKHEARYTVLER